MSTLIVTVDLDWACEPAIEEIFDFLKSQNSPFTVFTTHNSSSVKNNISEIDVGLHPYFDLNSSHGSTIKDVTNHVMDLPHNLAAFRCHRFASCNGSQQAMAEAGMLISSNVCTDLEIVTPFKNKFTLLEVPVFFEDGSYLWRQYPLEIDQGLRKTVLRKEMKVLLIHPMHFALNTPHFNYMYDIKQSLSREEWRNMTKSTLNKLRWKKRGIRDVIIDLIDLSSSKLALRTLLTAP